MRLATLSTDGRKKIVGVVPGDAGNDRFVDLATAAAACGSSARTVLESGCLKGLLALEGGLSEAAAVLNKATDEAAYIDGTLAAPVGSPSKIICIGLNYRDHAAESGMEIPTEPVCFSKFSSAIIGPGQAVKLPPAAAKVDYEAELVVVIGRRGRRIREAEARSYVAGYMNGNDVSARDWQIGRPGGQWLLGKTPDTFAPTGPYLVTADAVPDPHRLPIALRLNGETMQQSNTKEFIFTIDQLIAHLSQLITLEPGDLIFTGTPPGVGFARKPPVFLKPGDRVEVEIEGFGVLANPVEAD